MAASEQQQPRRPSLSDAAAWYFIDGEQQYRGPVTEATMHYLFSSGAITSETYLFSEQNATTHAWVRLRKLPELHAALSRPRALSYQPPEYAANVDQRPVAAEAAEAKADDGGPTLARRSEAGLLSPEPTEEASRTMSGLSTEPPGVFSDVASEEGSLSLARSDRASSMLAEASGSSPGPTRSAHAAAAPATISDGAASLEPTLPPPQLPPPGGAAGGSGSLFEYFAAAPAPPPPPAARTGSKLLWPFGRRGSSKGPTAFGQPLLSYPLDAHGVPTVLGQLRALLFGMRGESVEGLVRSRSPVPTAPSGHAVPCSGCTTELAARRVRARAAGIFRVSPGAAAKKLARQHVEGGQLPKIKEAECLAHLLKLWFRELPESVLAPCLQPVVDGPPRDAAGCAALVEALPEPHRATMRWLVRLLRDVAAHEEVNRMTPKSLSVVFAPNLVDAPLSMPPMLVLDLSHRVVAFLERLMDAPAVAAVEID